MVESVLLAIGAYLLGSVPASYLAAKWSRGIDIRQNGSGHVGASRIWRLTSKKVAVTVVLFDFGKGIGMVVLAQHLGIGISGQVAVGLAAIVGHNWPVFLNFNGGRGILTAMGIISIWWLPWGPVTFLAGAALTLLGKGSPLPVLIGIGALPVVSWGLGQPLVVIIGFLVLFLIVVIRRLTAPLSAEAAAMNRKQLLINRFLFDRDVREQETQLHIIPRKASLSRSSRKQQEGRKEG